MIEVTIGQRVRHPKFGFGEVWHLVSTEEAEVKFDKFEGMDRLKKIQINDLSYDGIDEYEDMYCDDCGGTACNC